MTINYQQWAEDYETDARRLAALAIKYRDRAKATSKSSERGELEHKAHRYVLISREFYRIAETLRERMKQEEE